MDNSLSVPGEIIPVWTTVQVSQGNFILEETAQFKSPRGNLFLQRQHTPSGTVPGGIPVQASPGKDFLLGQASSQRETKHHSPQSVHWPAAPRPPSQSCCTCQPVTATPHTIRVTKSTNSSTSKQTPSHPSCCWCQPVTATQSHHSSTNTSSPLYILPTMTNTWLRKWTQLKQ